MGQRAESKGKREARKLGGREAGGIETEKIRR